MKPNEDGPRKAASFPRMIRYKTASGKVEEIDTGLYIRRRMTHYLRGVVDFSKWEPYQPVDQTLSKVRTVVEKALVRNPPWPKHMRDLAEDLLIEISEAQDFIKLKDVKTAAASCLLIGKMFEMLRVSEVEPEFAKRRRSVEATRGPRQRDSVWNDLARYFMDAEKRGTHMTCGKLYIQYRAKFGGAHPMSLESFSRTYYRKVKGWRGNS